MRYLSLFALLLVLPATAQDYEDESVNVDTNVNVDTSMTGGDVSVSSSNRSFAFAHSLGDVDIAQCIASTQWGSILVSKQKVILNLWCVAEVYDHKGMHDMAALMRCDIGEIADHFVSNEACIRANTWGARNTKEGSNLPDPIEYFPQAEATKVLVEAEELHTEQTREFQDFNTRLDHMEAGRQRAIRAQQADQAYARDLIIRLEQGKENGNDPEG